MVQIVIKISESANEWGLIELQGFLQTEEENLAGLRIGDLHFDDKGIAYLIVGHHVLTGKIAPLSKPFAVIKKKPKHTVDEMEVDDENKSQETSYEIVAFLNQKIIFKNRPRPIIIKPAAISH